MCCFSAYHAGRRFRSVEKVSGTNIFARSSNGNCSQMLVYSMNLSSRIDLAMILPLPVPPASPDDAVRFISLQEYPEFFKDMKKGFPEYPPIPRSAGLSLSLAPALARPMLQVHDVGDFEASYVPTMNDWDRLDERFRIPPGIFDAVPAYREFGFAVFKLKATQPKSWFSFLGGKSATKTIHPMAFEFPRADPDHLFFPTVHVHDGRFHPTATFDHTLYCQIKALGLPGWRSSEGPARSFLQVSKANGVFDPDRLCYKKDIRGKHKNEDIWV
jgi:hypothetical protein